MSARINAMQINTEHAQHGMLYLLDMKQACKQCALKSTIDELTAYMPRGARRGLEGKEAEVVEITQELGPCMRATCNTSVSHTHTQIRHHVQNLLARDGTVVPPTEIGTSTQRDFTHLRRICDLKGDADEIRAVGVGAGCAEHDRCKKIRAPLGRTRTCSICRQRSCCASGDCAFIERHTPARLRDLQFAFKSSTT